MIDPIDRQAAIDAVDSEIVSTNPEHFKSSEKFIKFMDDADIASFGRWQWANGFNTAVVAAKIRLEQLPSADVVEVVRCRRCKYSDYLDGDYWCDIWGDSTNESGYCSYGRKRND